jgi:hypothetical protein
MPIDGCTHKWPHLSSVVLPDYMAKMRAAIATPIAMRTFAEEKKGAGHCAKHLGLNGDFSGCYVLIEHGKPIYAGISRGVVKRLIQHVRGDDENSASLAYRMAAHKNPHKLRRKVAMAKPAFRAAFESKRAFLCSLDVAFIEIDCPVELYAFELYCSLELDTGQWNTFRTH